MLKPLGSILALALLVGCNPSEKKTKMALTYPETREDSTIVETYFGTDVSDPYRWLEDDRSEETTQWVQAQNEVTQSYLGSIPFKKILRDRLEILWNYEKIGSPFIEGKYTYFFKNDGLQNQSVMYRIREEGAEPEVFLDPNSFSEDGTTSLAGLSFSEDGSIIAYQISEGGSDWRKVIIRDVETLEILEDTLYDVKFSGTSWKGNEGFYYSSYDKPVEGSELSGLTQHHKLFFHKLGTKQSDDLLIFGGKDLPRRYINGTVTEDNRFLIINAAVSTTGDELYIQDLSKPDSPIMPIIIGFENEYGVIHSEGDDLYISTNFGAPNKRIMKMNILSPARETWTEIIAENEMPLSAGSGCGYLFGTYLKDATSLVRQFNLKGELLREIELPGVGSAGGFGGRWDDKELYYSFTNSIQPSTIYKFNPENGQSEIYQKPNVDFDPALYETKQIFYTSKDGTQIPMIISHKKGIQMDGSNPTILYGYGGFNISLTPSFSVANLVWMENGGVYAVANLRGGGEYGEEWHTAGTQMKKQNVFDDFIAAAEYLMKEGYTSKEKIGIKGGSNGGLLVGACMTQRPDLFAVALPAVGVLDMLRYHKFTAGAGWAYDYGTSEDSEEMFRYLIGYSPVHNCKPNTSYPATMITTADHDDRVVPAHSFKFAAALQKAHVGENPVLIRIETNAGHGAGKPTSMILDEAADLMAFSFYNMGIENLGVK
jgi:prolyl oligopeptidase